MLADTLGTDLSDESEAIGENEETQTNSTEIENGDTNVDTGDSLDIVEDSNKTEESVEE